MDVLLGDHVDLITPFPAKELDRVWSWMQCFRSIVFHDGTKDTTKESCIEAVAALNHPHMAFGIIDKNNVINSQSEAPIVGIVLLEPVAEHNYVCHIATNRRVGKAYKLYKKSMTDEAGKLVIADAFATNPKLERITATVMASNTPVISLLKRLDFIQEAHLHRWFTQNGHPVDAVQYCYLRPHELGMEES